MQSKAGTRRSLDLNSDLRLLFGVFGSSEYKKHLKLQRVNVAIDASAHTDVFPPTLGGVAPAVALRVVRQGQQVDAGGASARAKDSDAQRVTTEGRNVLTGPAQSLDQVQQAVVALGCLVTSAQEACGRTREEERWEREQGQRHKSGSTFPPEKRAKWSKSLA